MRLHVRGFTPIAVAVERVASERIAVDRIAVERRAVPIRIVVPIIRVRRASQRSDEDIQNETEIHDEFLLSNERGLAASIDAASRMAERHWINEGALVKGLALRAHYQNRTRE